jgi:hypothetical protein
MNEVTNNEALTTQVVSTTPKKRAPRKPKEELKPVQELQPIPSIVKNLGQQLPKPMSVHEKRAQLREEAEAKLKLEWERESQKVTGVFRDLEVGAGGHLRFSARKYKWDPIEDFDFNDGHTYTIPLWVAKHLNNNCKHPVYKHNVDPNAKPGEKVQQYVNSWNHRFAFISNDYMGLVQAEKAPIMMVGNQ